MIEIFRLSVKTEGNTDIIDLTPLIQKNLKKSKIKRGIVNIFSPGSTVSISTMEYEPNLIKDVKNVFERIAPSDVEYEHHKTWGDFNGHSHVRATLTGASISIPFENQELLLGTWQQVVLIDFDVRPREREVILTLMGE